VGGGRRLRDAEGAEAPGTPTAEAARRPRGAGGGASGADGERGPGAAGAHEDAPAPRDPLSAPWAPADAGEGSGGGGGGGGDGGGGGGGGGSAPAPADERGGAAPELQRLEAELAALAQQVAAYPTLPEHALLPTAIAGGGRASRACLMSGGPAHAAPLR